MLEIILTLSISDNSGPNDEKKQTAKGKIMCKKLKELMGLSASKILETYYSEADSYAVDMQRIMKKIGVPVYSLDFSELNQELEHSIWGAIILRGENLAVCVSNKCSQAEQRFILAHELGHCCLHGATLKASKIECISDFDSKDNPHEHEADIFADQLLLPEKEFIEVCNKMMAPKKDVNVLADIFCVPTTCVIRRLKSLELN